MVDAVVSFGAGLLVGGFSLMLVWGLLWLGIGSIGLVRQTCARAIVLSSLSSSAIAVLSILGIFWVLDAARLSSFAFQFGLAGLPSALFAAGFYRLEDGRRAGPAFIEGSR
ncbi:MAG: rane protein of unknown function, partial [Nitrospira sp.]|nr:rane protein of unknown function [Nitrospira sp.]